MSSPNYAVKFSVKARKDLVGIITYTLGTWGDAQAVKYQAIINESLALIADSPENHRQLEPYFYVRSGEHYIFYRLKNHEIIIVRILHNKMDFTKYLKGLVN